MLNLPKFLLSNRNTVIYLLIIIWHTSRYFKTLIFFYILKAKLTTISYINKKVAVDISKLIDVKSLGYVHPTQKSDCRTFSTFDKNTYSQIKKVSDFFEIRQTSICENCRYQNVVFAPIDVTGERFQLSTKLRIQK